MHEIWTIDADQVDRAGAETRDVAGHAAQIEQKCTGIAQHACERAHIVGQWQERDGSGHHR